MRSLVPLVLAAAACYRPSLDHERCVQCGANAECPGDLACVAGVCGGPQACTQATDASATIDTGIVGDALPDGTPNQNCPLTGFDGPATPLSIVAPSNTPATLTTNAAHTIAAFKYTTENIGLAVAGTSSFMAIISDGASRNHAPKLSPEGNEIFMQTDLDRQTVAFSFRVAYRSATDTWSEPQLLTVRNNNGVPISISINDFPGTPTAFGAVPRRMLYLRVIQPLEWIELRESSDGSEMWNQVGTYTSASFGLREIYHPQLSSDGRVVVFVGEDLTGMLAIYAALRVNPTQPFNGNAFKLREGAHGQAHPFLSDDCRRLYYNDLQSGIVMVENP